MVISIVQKNTLHNVQNFHKYVMNTESGHDMHFYIGLDRFVVHNVFLSVFFGGSIATIKMGKSTRFRLDVSASLSLLQYVCA